MIFYSRKLLFGRLVFWRGSDLILWMPPTHGREKLALLRLLDGFDILRAHIECSDVCRRSFHLTDDLWRHGHVAVIGYATFAAALVRYFKWVALNWPRLVSLVLGGHVKLHVAQLTVLDFIAMLCKPPLPVLLVDHLDTVLHGGW